MIDKDQALYKMSKIVMKMMGRFILYIKILGIRRGLSSFFQACTGELGIFAGDEPDIYGKKKIYRIKEPGNSGNSIFLRSGSSDLAVFEQIFIKRDYNIDRFRQSSEIRGLYENYVDRSIIPIVIDCGANIGCSSIWFKELFPKSVVYAVEPHPQTCAVLRKNAESHADMIVVEAAIWNVPTTLKITRPHGDAWAIRVGERSPDGDDEMQVPAVTIGDLRQRVGDKGRMLIVKIDIEGAESELFSSNTAWIAETPLIIVELHDWMLPWTASSNNILKTLLQNKRDYVFSGDNIFCFLHPDFYAR